MNIIVFLYKVQGLFCIRERMHNMSFQLKDLNQYIQDSRLIINHYDPAPAVNVGIQNSGIEYILIEGI